MFVYLVDAAFIDGSHGGVLGVGRHALLEDIHNVIKPVFFMFVRIGVEDAEVADVLLDQFPGG